MSQEEPEAILAEQRRAAVTADDVAAQNVRNAQMDADSIDAARVEENREARTHAAEYLGQDVDEYPDQQVQTRTPVEQYLELGYEQNPTEALAPENAASAAAENAAAATDRADQAAADAARANDVAAQNAAPPEPAPRNANDPQTAAEISRLLYENGAFVNGGVGGVMRPAAAGAQPQDGGPANVDDDEDVPAPATVDDPAEIDPGSSPEPDGENAVDEFSRHLQRQPPRRDR